MKKINKIFCWTILTLFFQFADYSQNCNTLNIQLQSEIASTCSNMTMTMMHDELNRPYLFVANKEAGLKIYDISVIATPSLVATVPTSLYDALDVMSVSQNGNYLYLALGNSFTNPQKSGMAIVDVSNPSSPLVTDFEKLNSSPVGGAGIVKVEGNYAYLGAMNNGLVILDVTNKNNIRLVSQIIPSLNYPPIRNPDPKKYNARGMEVRNSIVYLCYDAGGIRIINCTNKLSPVETGHWCNPVMYTPLDHPKAYNNCVLDDSLLYVAVDYAGMEVLDISDTSNIQLLGWWNPYNAPNNNWFTSPSHCNEIKFEKNCKLIFMSCGKSDMQVIDVSNPALPDSCNFYGGVSNNIGTWGIGMWQNEIYLSYICAVVPFSSNWTGVKILTYNSCSSGIDKQEAENKLTIFPNPFSTHSVLKSEHFLENVTLTMDNVFGETVRQIKNISGHTVTLSRDNLPCGLYFVRLAQNNRIIITKKILITD